jgi:hypothetical protein
MAAGTGDGEPGMDDAELVRGKGREWRGRAEVWRKREEGRGGKRRKWQG